MLESFKKKKHIMHAFNLISEKYLWETCIYRGARGEKSEGKGDVGKGGCIVGFFPEKGEIFKEKKNETPR